MFAWSLVADSFMGSYRRAALRRRALCRCVAHMQQGDTGACISTQRRLTYFVQPIFQSAPAVGDPFDNAVVDSFSELNERYHRGTLRSVALTLASRVDRSIMCDMLGRGPWL